MTRTSTTLGVVLLVSVAFAGTALAATDPAVRASPDDPGATAKYTVMVSVGDATAGSSLSGLRVNLQQAGTDVSDVGVEDVAVMGIDRAGDSTGRTVDVSLEEEIVAVDVENNGHTMTVTFGGSYSLHRGDQLVLVFDEATNPSTTGEYPVPLDINPQSSGGEATATLVIDGSDDGSAAQSTPTGTATPTDTATPTATATDTPMADGENAAQSTETSGPGFGLVAGVLALVGAALIAARRR